MSPYSLYMTGHITVRAFFVALCILMSTRLLAQADMVPIFNQNHAVNVYDFLKTMRVKKILTQFNDDNLNLSRGETLKLLRQIESKRELLSQTERLLLERYFLSFSEEKILDSTVSTVFIDGAGTFGYRLGDMFFSDKEKFFYFRRLSEKSTFFIDMLGNGTQSYQFSPEQGKTALIWDGGFRGRGTLFGTMGYMLSFNKGFLLGDRDVMVRTRPALRTNFKFLENIDAIPSYDFAEGYLRFEFDPEDDLHLSLQFGREDIRYGLGYGSRLVWSGETPPPDMLKFNLSYGIVHFSQLHLSVPGDFSIIRGENFTKYFAMQRLKLGFEDVMDAGIGVISVYAGRGIDFAYLNPFLFYKFAEHSLQDRDNALMFFDVQTHFIKNVEFQGTFLMDETPDIGNLSRFTNKWAFQVGSFVYEAFGIENLTCILEYTYIRPYTYTHVGQQTVYSSWGVNVGSRLDPNSDELLGRINYNFTDRIRLTCEGAFGRHGRNRVDENGTLLQNVGSDINQTIRFGVDAEEVPFLSGERINRWYFGAQVTFEPWKNYLLEFRYHYRQDNLIERGQSERMSIFVFRFGFEY